MDGRKKPWEAGKCRKTRRKTKKYAAAVLVHDPSPSLFDTLFPEREQVDNYEREREGKRPLLAAINVGGFYDTVFPFWSIIEATGERPTDAEPSPPSSFLLLLRSLLLTKTSGEIHLRLAACRPPISSSTRQFYVIAGSGRGWEALWQRWKKCCPILRHVTNDCKIV